MTLSVDTSGFEDGKENYKLTVYADNDGELLETAKLKCVSFNDSNDTWTFEVTDIDGYSLGAFEYGQSVYITSNFITYEYQAIEDNSFAGLTPTVSLFETVSEKVTTFNNKLNVRLIDGLATVGITGSYNDLLDKPTIPDAVSGVHDNTNWTSLTIGNDTYSIGGGAAPSNMVTTDTAQTITGTKTLDANAFVDCRVGHNRKLYFGNPSNTTYCSPVFSGGNEPGGFNALTLNNVVASSGFGASGFYPVIHNSLDLGLSGSYTKYWRDLYLSRYLSDGTNSITIADIVTTDTAQTINGQKTFTKNIMPSGSINLGSSAKRFSNIYVNNVESTNARIDKLSANTVSSYIGSSTLPFNTAYITNLSDGTNNIAIADIASKSELPDAVSGTNDGTNWTSLTIGADTYGIGGGSGGGTQLYAHYIRTGTYRVCASVITSSSTAFTAATLATYLYNNGLNGTSKLIPASGLHYDADNQTSYISYGMNSANGIDLKVIFRNLDNTSTLEQPIASITDTVVAL